MSSYAVQSQLETEIDQMADDLIEALVRRSQEKCASLNKPQPNDCLDAGTAVKHVVSMLGLEPLNRYEATELEALSYYITKKLNLSEETLKTLLLEEFDIHKISDIQRCDFMRIQKYLIDILHGAKVA